MAQRIADGKKIYREPWSNLTRDVFFWLLFEGADSLGMQPERPGAISECLSDPGRPVSRRAVQESLDILCAGKKPTLVRYEVGGARFLVFRQWQKHQKIKWDSSPTCPFPPEETLKLVGSKTRDLLLRNYGVNSEVPPGLLGPTVSASVSVTGSSETTTGRAKRGRKLTDEQNDVKQRLIDHYQECMVAFCEDETPEFNGGHAAGFFTQQILKGRAEEKLTATIDAFFDAQDGLRRVRRERAATGGYKPKPVDVTFDVFKSKFQGYWSEVAT